MKKIRGLFVIILSSIILCSCSTNKAVETASVTSSNQSSTSTKQTDSSGSNAQIQESVNDSEISIATMNIEEISQGDFSSILGVWRNSKGDTLVFNDSGLVSDNSRLASNSTIKDGVLETSVVAEVGGYTLLMIPKGTILSESYFIQGSDQSDSSRDRMIGTKQLFDSSDSFDPYYRIRFNTANLENPLTSTETGISLESGQDTIDYANSFIGEHNWTIIESNYNRTESIPFELLQGDNGVLYRVYQNGVVFSETKNLIVYIP